MFTNEIRPDFVFYKFDLDTSKYKLEVFMYLFNKDGKSLLNRWLF